MAYSNVTPPTLPAYDSETYGFYLLVFNYEQGAEDWYMVQLYYSSWRFRYEEGVGVVGSPATFLCSYSDGTWSDTIEINGEELALTPGLFGQTYQRIYTNANIFNGDEIWLAENSVTPVEGKKFPIQDFLNGLVMALCGRPLQWPKAEPVAYLYNGVRLPGLPEVEYPVLVMHYDPNYKDYFLVAFERQNYFTSYDFNLFGNKDGDPKAVMFVTAGEAWEKESQTDWSFAVDKDDPKLEMYPVIWTNFDLNYSDGTLYCAKSEPVPVYEQGGI